MFYYVKLKGHLLADNNVLSMRSGFEYHDQFIGILFSKPEKFAIYKPSAKQLIAKYKFTFKLSMILFILCLVQFVFTLNGI